MILIALLLLALAEVAALLAVGSEIGVLPTVGLLVLGMVVGSWLVRQQGARAWRALGAAMAERRPPGREVVDGVLVLLGGALVVFPGFVSDVLGLLCLLPPTRALLRGVVLWYAARRAGSTVVRVRSQRGPGAQAPFPDGPDRPAQPRVIEGEIAPPTDEKPDRPDPT